MSSANSSVAETWEELPVEFQENLPVSADPGVPANDDAEPILSDVEQEPRGWALSLQWLVFLLLIFGYPASVLAAHNINDRDVILSSDAWVSESAGIVSTLVSREVNTNGWAQDRDAWHPQARLTALPAWQEGIIEASSDWIGALAEASDNDSDLVAAARLLSPTDQRPVTPRLQAALEALERYNSRLGSEFASAPASKRFLATSLDDIEQTASDMRSALAQATLDQSDWPATPLAIEAFYDAKAQAHVIEQRLRTLHAQAAMTEAEANEAFLADLDVAIANWARAAEFKPLFVMNQTGSGVLETNHLAVMSFYYEQAETATEAIGLVPNDPQPAVSTSPEQTAPAP